MPHLDTGVAGSCGGGSHRASPSGLVGPMSAPARSLRTLQRRAGVVVQPPPELAHGDQPAPTAPHDPQLVEHVVLHEVHAHAERAPPPASTAQAALLRRGVSCGLCEWESTATAIVLLGRARTPHPPGSSCSRVGQFSASRPRHQTAFSGFGGRWTAVAALSRRRPKRLPYREEHES
jgi:hypothetical protein